jgi:hypothetical protein
MIAEKHVGKCNAFHMGSARVPARQSARIRRADRSENARTIAFRFYGGAPVEISRGARGRFAAANTIAETAWRGVSDRVAGRRLGRPSGHFKWSLTPRYCY